MHVIASQKDPAEALSKCAGIYGSFAEATRT
jgi:hypothetical protein